MACQAGRQGIPGPHLAGYRVEQVAFGLLAAGCRPCFRDHLNQGLAELDVLDCIPGRADGWGRGD